MDAIDAALVSFSSDGVPELEAYREAPYGATLRRRLRVAQREVSPGELADLDVAVGEAFVGTAVALLEEAGRDATGVRAVGSHGQTLAHRPPRKRGQRGSSLQIGSPAVVAEGVGVTTVADFRARDLAVGGQGAPLVPILDHRLYSDPRLGRVALNVGGIANVTGLPPSASLEDIVAFDTGPGNVLLDAVARERGLPDGIDHDGETAAAGRVDRRLLRKLLDHPFLRREPPRSADIEEDLLAPWCRMRAFWEDLETQDLLRTLVEFTAATVADGIERFLAPRQAVDEVVVSGGGGGNRTLVSAIEERLRPARVRPASDVGGIPGEAKEAVLFALLARETLAGRPGNVPAATGARRPVVLGVVVPGGRD